MRSPFTHRLKWLLGSKTPAIVYTRGHLVPVEKVDWVESANNYVLLHCGPKTHLLSETLTGLEKRLDPAKFVRVHRGRIVNVSRIVAAHTMMNGTYELELNTGARLSTGRQFLEAVQRLIRRSNCQGQAEV